MMFDTYYWHGSILHDPALEHACQQLASPTSEAAGDQAFRTLLGSGQTAAMGIALDHYRDAESMARHGFDNKFAAYAREVLERARELLRQAPLSARETAAKEDGANHASALGAMMNLAGPEDSELIAHAFEMATTGSVREAATMAAGTVLERSSVPQQHLIIVLGEAVLDDSRSSDDRWEALEALGHADSPQATSIVLQAAQARDLRLQVSAALILADRDLATHRILIEQLVASWPEDAPYPASDVRGILEENEGEDPPGAE